MKIFDSNIKKKQQVKKPVKPVAHKKLPPPVVYSELANKVKELEKQLNDALIRSKSKDLLLDLKDSELGISQAKFKELDKSNKQFISKITKRYKTLEKEVKPEQPNQTPNVSPRANNVMEYDEVQAIQAEIHENNKKIEKLKKRKKRKPRRKQTVFERLYSDGSKAEAKPKKKMIRSRSVPKKKD